MAKESFEIYHFEPVKFHNELYGKSIKFDHTKNQIKFSSEYHQPGYLHYDQIKEVLILYDKKRRLLWVGLLTLLLFVGIFILFARTHLPPWKISITLKKEKKPIIIRARFPDNQGVEFADFCTLKLKTILIIPEKK